MLHDSGGSPLLSWVHLSYLPKNLPPQIEDVVLQDPNVRVQGIQGIVIGDRQGAMPRLRMPQARDHNLATSVSAGGRRPEHAAHFDAPPQASSQKGYQSVLWLAQDDNDDDLVYSVYFRGEGEKQWKLLKDNLHDPFYSWDTSSMADGGYYLKIVASDAPSNPPAEALETSRESERFEVDNTPPTVSGLEAQPNAGAARIRFRAKDSGSAVSRAEYSVDAGDWKIVEPEGRLSDSPEESYDFSCRAWGTRRAYCQRCGLRPLRKQHGGESNGADPRRGALARALLRGVPLSQAAKTTAPDLETIREAHRRIAPHIHRTPVFTSASLDEIAGAKLFFKCENLQRTGSFKIRGATNAIFSLSDAEAARGVVTHSSGNHAAALSSAARRRGIPAWVVMPKNAPKVKCQAVEAYGGKITFCEPTLQARESTAAEIQARTGAILIHPFDNDRIIAGQGTAALELLEEVPDLDFVIAPVSGGGLLSGTATAVPRASSPNSRDRRRTEKCR